MLTRLNAVSTFGLLGFMLQHVEGGDVPFPPPVSSFLFLSWKEKRLAAVPRRRNPNQPTVFCQFLTRWNIKSEEMFPPSLDVLTRRDVGFRICMPVSPPLSCNRRADRPRASGLELFQGLLLLFHPACNMSHALFTCIKKKIKNQSWPRVHFMTRKHQTNSYTCPAVANKWPHP